MIHKHPTRASDEPYHFFTCACDDSTKLTVEELKKHAQEKHNVDLTGLKGHRELVMHINRKPRQAATYKWTVAGLPVIQEYYG